MTAVIRLMDRHFLPIKKAQRRFRGQRIRTVHAILPRVWRRSPRGAEQRDHRHRGGRSATYTAQELNLNITKPTRQKFPCFNVSWVRLHVICSIGDDVEHEQDTVLQLQEVIEQLRNVFPSEPGESFGPGKHTLYNSINPEWKGMEGEKSKHTAAWEGGQED